MSKEEESSTGKNLSRMGVARYPPFRILGNEYICEEMKRNITHSEEPIAIVGHWGTGKTHFGYRLFWEINNPKLPDLKRQLVSQNFAQDSFAFFVTLKMLKSAQYPLTPEGLLELGLISLSSDKLEEVMTLVFEDHRILYDDAQGQISEQDMDDFTNFVRTRIGLSQSPLDTRAILNEMSERFGFKTFVIVIDELEEAIEGTTYSIEEMHELLQNLKQTFERDRPVNITFVFLVAESVWAEYERTLPARSAVERRVSRYVIERQPESGYSDFIDQRCLPGEIKNNPIIVKALWKISGRNHGFFEGLLANLFDRFVHDSDLLKGDEINLIQDLITSSRIRGRYLIDTPRWDEILAPLEDNENEEELMRILLYSGEPLKKSDICKKLNIDSDDFDEIVQSINIAQGRDEVEIIQEFTVLSLNIKEDKKEKRLRITNKAFYENLKEDGLDFPTYLSGKGMDALSRTPEPIYKNRYIIPINSLDFGARLQWNQPGVFLSPVDSERIHNALLQLKDNTAENLFGISWLWMGRIIKAFRTRIPADALKSEKMIDIQEWLSKDVNRRNSILRGFVISLQEANLVKIDDKGLEIVPHKATIYSVEPNVVMIFPTAGNLKLSVQILFAEQTIPDKRSLIMEHNKRNLPTIFLTPPEKIVQLPDTWLHITCQDPGLLSLLGTHSNSQSNFKSITEITWDEIDYIAAGGEILSERKKSYFADIDIQHRFLKFLQSLVEKGECIFPCLPKEIRSDQRDSDERSPSLLINRSVLQNVIAKYLNQKCFIPLIKHLETNTTPRKARYFGAIKIGSEYLPSVEPVISDEGSFLLTNSGKNIIEMFRGRGAFSDLNELVRTIKNQKIVTRASGPSLTETTIENVLTTHIEVLFSMGCLLKKSDGKIECVLGEELEYLNRIINRLTSIIDEVKSFEERPEKSWSGLLNYLKISSETDLLPWLESLDQIRNAFGEKKNNSEWMHNLRLMIPRVYFLLGTGDLHDDNSSLFWPIAIHHEKIELDEEDISKQHKSYRSRFSTSNPLSCLGQILAHSTKDVDGGGWEALTLRSMFDSAKVLMTKYHEEYDEVKKRLSSLDSDLQEVGFTSSGKVRSDLINLQKELDRSFKLLIRGELGSFLSGIAETLTKLEKYEEQWEVCTIVTTALEVR